MVKFIVIAGGVMSGVGKGVTTASVGKILQELGYKVTAVKIDPYINYDAGTLRPTEHGEVWVTDDGGEIDQDLGNYERFLGIEIPKKNNITTGQIYGKVIENERAGKYLGETVQFIPHIPDEIKKRVNEAAKGYDFCLIEIGGTIGDYENIPYLFAMKSLEREIGKENIMYMLITYLPVPSHIEEMKTKPTQQAIRLLTEHGIIPDFIICRANKALDDVRKRKIEIYANIKSDHVISEPDIDTIYRIPLDLEKEKFSESEFVFECATNYLLKNFWHNFVHCRLQGITDGNYGNFGGAARYDSDFEADNLATVFLVLSYGLPVYARGKRPANEAIKALWNRNRCNLVFQERASHRHQDQGRMTQLERFQEAEWRFFRTICNRLSIELISGGLAVRSLRVFANGTIKKGRVGFFRAGNVIVELNSRRYYTRCPVYVPHEYYGAKRPTKSRIAHIKKFQDRRVAEIVTIAVTQYRSDLEESAELRGDAERSLKSLIRRVGLPS